MDEHLQFYWSAFNDLTTERQIGMGVGPIPYSSIRNYAADYRISGRDEFDYFLRLITAMDTKYLSIVNSSNREPELVPISDVEGQHRLFARIAERAKNAPKIHGK